MKKLYFVYIIMILQILLLSSCSSYYVSSVRPTPIAAEITPDMFLQQTAHSTQVPTPSPTPIKYNEYNVVLDVDPVNLKVTGIEKVKFTNNSSVPLLNIYMNTYFNAFASNSNIQPYFDGFKSKIFQNGKYYGRIKIINVAINNEDTTFEHDQTVLSINLQTPMKQTESLELSIQFEAVIPKINHRTGANDKAIWFGNFLPTLAVFDGSGWHTDKYYPAGDPFFTEIANFNVVVNAPSEYNVVGTGIETTLVSDKKKSTTLNAKLVRDFAFAISKYYKESSLTTDSGIDITFYHYSDIKNIDEYLELADKSLKYYSEVVGSYPYNQLDIIECGLFFNAGMEYPEIIFMDSTYLRDRASLRTLAHEIGHQWFYNVIGNDQVNDYWLDEGLTMLVQEGMFYDDYSLYSKMSEDYNILNERLANISDTAINQNLSVYKSWSDYYNISYTKSKLMFYSLKIKMGELFPEFLKTYYTSFSFQISTKESFIKIAEDVYGSSLQDFFDGWFSNGDLPPLIH